MKPLLNALAAYFAAGTPERRTLALTALVDVYNQARAAPEPETLALPPVDIAAFQALAGRAGFDSVEALLSAIAAAPPLVDHIAGFLGAPKLTPAGGLLEILIRPEKPVTRGIARISISPAWVTVFLPEKHDAFRDTVKGLGYDWDENGSTWQKSVSGWARATNAAAELGHTLLRAGFWVGLPTPEVRDLIVGEDFDPEVRRQVMARAKGQYEGWLVLWWARSEDCYAAAKRITGSRYSKPVVVVPPEHYDEVEDFATRYDFIITPAAQRVIDRARAALDAALLVIVDDDEPEPSRENGRPALAIPETVEIDDALVDDD